MSEPLPYLFSVDVEDPHPPARGGRSRAPALVETYLEFLRRHEARATFFVVGELARREPAMVRAIATEGHELACHSDRHVPLDRMDPASFRDDLRRNRDALAAAGAGGAVGYRAPCFSLTAATRWAYRVLAEEGFAYSSSVLPARNPLYGWPGFGAAPRRVDGVLELPMTLLPWPRVPAAGGVYFRALPRPLLALGLRRLRREGRPVLGYFHPYDIDVAAPRRAFPGMRRWSPFNLLLHANRRAVLPRLEAMLRMGFAIKPYREHAAAEAARPPAGEQAVPITEHA